MIKRKNNNKKWKFRKMKNHNKARPQRQGRRSNNNLKRILFKLRNRQFKNKRLYKNSKLNKTMKK